MLRFPLYCSINGSHDFIMLNPMLFGSVGVFAKEDMNEFMLANKMINGMMLL